MTAVQRPSDPIDTRSMVCVHTFLRREFRLAAGVIRSVNACDTRRARIVADHLEFVTTFLHHHHAGEDRLLWPKLMARVPEELAPIVQLMQAQHEHVAALLQDIEPVRARWRSQAREEDRDELARTFDELYIGLSEHLDAEEQRLLPIAARTVSRAEWQQLDEEGRNGIRKPGPAAGAGNAPVRGRPAGRRGHRPASATPAPADRPTAITACLPQPRLGGTRHRDALSAPRGDPP